MITHLRSAGVSVVLDHRGSRLPVVAYWGADLGEVDSASLRTVVGSGDGTLPPNGLDVCERPALLPQHVEGWLGTPALSGARPSGADWSPLFTMTDVETSESAAVFHCTDATAQLSLVQQVVLEPGGLLRTRTTLVNDHTTLPYQLHRLDVVIPVPARATELLDLAGGWSRERQPQRHRFVTGTFARECRRGRTGTDATLLLVAGTAGFDFRTGEVWCVHVGWSGNHVTYAERSQSGTGVLGAGELLWPGELVLAPCERYESPWVYAAYGHGLDELSARFHDYLRSRPGHPATPRPVVLNTWEAVYFEQDPHRLSQLASRAATVGVERFVLDDGWFRGRRSDGAGLGDWFVDEKVWPDGLHPLVRQVREFGMQFALWVEPEMISADSDLFRAHPDWVVATDGRLPPTGRGQHVLDLTRPDAWQYVFERLDSLVTEYAIDALKWDHNRDLVDASVHAQTTAALALMDALRAAHPGLEIESCASGGGRVDLAVLERTDRVWASDCIDPHERQRIDRWTQLLLPPELVGSHIGRAHSHTTGRTHPLAFRAGTALFASLGVEWDLTTASDAELEELRWWIEQYKSRRDLLHSGRVVRANTIDPGLLVHGVVSQDGRHALFCIVWLEIRSPATQGWVHLDGLDPDRAYRVTALAPDGPPTSAHAAPDWLRHGVDLPGRVLGAVGLAPPHSRPDSIFLLDVTALD